MRKIALFAVLLLHCFCFGQTTETGKSQTTGADLWEFFSGSGPSSIFDLAVPSFPDGPLLMPIGNDPLAYTKQGVPSHTVYLDDASNLCPKAPSGCGIYTGHVNASGVCAGCTLITPFTGHADYTDLDTITGRVGSVGWDGTYWDVWVTHVAHFDSTSAWIWPDVFGATAWLDFHSDCVEFSQAWDFTSTASACSSTNDYGYNPRGRQVTTHGGMDSGLNPPLPNMGYRNRYGDGSVLGFPSTSAPLPITSAAYPITNCASGVPLPCTPSSNPYNDLANMWSLSSSNNGGGTGGTLGSVIQMGSAHVGGGTACYGFPCPNDGVNHINIHDAHIFPDPACSNNCPVGNNIKVIDISSAEWGTNPNNNPLVSGFLAAAPHDIWFSEDLFTSDTDEDGFGVVLVAGFMTLSAVRSGVTHSALYGDSRNGLEGHGFNFGPPGPMTFIDNWCEGNSICMWGGGGASPPICNNNSGGGLQCTDGLLTGNVERARNHVSYPPRWLPASGNSNGHGNGGVQGDVEKITSYTCSSGQLTITTAAVGAVTGEIYNPVIFIQGLSSIGVVERWYGVSNTTGAGITPGTSIIVPGSGCGAGTVTGAKIYGYEGTTSGGVPLVVTSVAAMNSVTCGSATWGTLQSPCNPILRQNPVFKNLNEWKESYAFWVDGELWENSGIDAQEGQCSSHSVRACSGASKCGDGFSENIHDFLVSNTMCRHAAQGMLHDGRSNNGGYSCWPHSASCAQTITLTSEACEVNATTTAAITVTGPQSVPVTSTIYLFSGQTVSVGGTENVTITAVVPGVSFAANFTQTHVNSTSIYTNVVDFTYSANPDIIDSEFAVGLSKFNPSACATGQTTKCQQFTGTDVYIYGTGDGLLPDGWYQTENISYSNIIPVLLHSGTCGGHTFSLTGTLVGRQAGATDGAGVTPGMHHGVTNNFLLYDQGDHTRWNGTGSAPSITNSPGGNNYGIRTIMGPASGITDPITGLPSCTSSGHTPGTIASGVACVQTVTINACPAATYGAIPDCPRLLQAETGDLMNIVCPTANVPANCSIFATATAIPAGSGGGDPGTKGVPIIDLDPNQLWFTYAPPGYSSGNAGLVANIPQEPPGGFGIPCPGDCGSSGLYARQSYPKTMYYNHITTVGVNGAYVTGGSFDVDLTFKNSLTVVPGTGDTGAPAGSFPCSGGTRCGLFSGSDAYSGPNSGTCIGGSTFTTGVLNLGDPVTLTFSNWGVATRTLTNYPRWLSNTPGCSNDGYLPNENSTPLRASTPGAGVTCNGGLACTTTNDNPDSIGFVGAMNTNAYPLNLPDFRQYALDPSSPYKAGGILQSDDMLDDGAIIPYTVNASARTIRPVLSSGYTYYHDGPQYEWLTWTCSGTCASFTVLEDSNPVLTTSNLYAQIFGLVINSSHTWAVTSAHGGDVVVVTVQTMY